MIYTFDPYTLDTERLELRRGTERVEVEPQVFRLLVCLIENRGRVVDKDELIEDVWSGRIVSDATLNTRINAARRAVGDDGKTQSVIRTFPRRGFRFVKEVTAKSEAGQSANGRADQGESRLPPEPGHKPTIVVLPFQCVGNDAEDFGNGLAAMIVTELSRRTGVDVINRRAAERLSTQPVDFTQIKDSVGAEYALTGTVHRVGRRLRVSVELCETGRGRQIWTERYDRELGDALALQEDLSHVILMAARWNMAAYDGERAARMPGAELSIGDRLSRAAQYFYTPTPESYRAAIELLDGVLGEDPRHSMALSMRAFAGYVSSTFRVEPMSAEDCARLKDMADLALEQDERSDFAHWVRGTLALNLDRDHHLALTHSERAHSINPHFAASLRLKGEILCFSDEPGSGISLLEELVAADPRAPGNAIAFWDMALGHFSAQRMEKALDAIDEALVRIRTMPDFYLARAAILSQLGRTDDVRTLVEHLISRYKPISVTRIRRPPFKHGHLAERYSEALRDAGLSE